MSSARNWGIAAAILYALLPYATRAAYTAATIAAGG